MPRESFARGRVLRGFADPVLCRWPEQRPVPDPRGLWLLGLGIVEGAADLSVHAVAVEVTATRTGYRRRLADNRYRDPVLFKDLRGAVYAGVVGAGWRLANQGGEA